MGQSEPKDLGQIEPMVQLKLQHCRKAILPRTQWRKTNWDSTPLEEIAWAANDVKNGKSIRSVAKDKSIVGIKNELNWVKTVEAKRVLTEEVDKELADHMKKLGDQFHGLTPKKWCELGNGTKKQHSWPQQLEGFLACKVCRKLHNSLGQHRLTYLV